LHGFELQFRIAKSSIASVVGRGGVNITKIKQQWDIRADFVGFEDPEDVEEVEVQLEGTREGCQGAKESILEFIEEKVRELFGLCMCRRISRLRLSRFLRIYIVRL
jgi:hypothetical protein